MTDTTYAVTGATGGLGHGIVTSLLDRGADPAHVIAVVRDPAKAADLAERGVTVRVGDYDRPDTLATAFEGVDVLVLVSSSDPGQRIPQHTAVIEAATAAGVSRIVYTSAPQADTSSFSLVDDHRATEELLQAGTVPYTVLRNNWYVENYTRDLDATLERGSAIGSAHDGRVGLALRADYAEAAAAAAFGDGHENAVYELAGPLVTLDDFYRALSAATGRTVTYVDLSTEDHLAALLEAGLPDPVAGFVVSIDTAIANGELATAPDDLVALLGRPPVPLDEALHRIVGA
ncbi:SDR family oxidoreductase [Jatrophihabitans sp. YIM 134969]